MKMINFQGQNIPIKMTREDTETNKTSSLSNFMPQMLADDEIAEHRSSLYSKQREVFNVVHTCAKDYIKYNGHNIEPIHIFLSSSRGKGKSHLMKVIYHAILKTLLYHCQDAD